MWWAIIDFIAVSRSVFLLGVLHIEVWLLPVGCIECVISSKLSFENDLLKSYVVDEID